MNISKETRTQYFRLKFNDPDLNNLVKDKYYQITMTEIHDGHLHNLYPEYPCLIEFEEIK